jgi:hypothetical protein
VVKAEEKEFKVHEELLCNGSAFFASASNKEWVEVRKHCISLPDDDPSIVDLYLQWIYSGRTFSRQSTDGAPEDGKEFDLLVDGFVFGEKVQNGDFKDAVVDALIKSFAVPDKRGQRWCPAAPWVDRAYAGTPEGSPLRRLLVARYVFHATNTWLHGTTNIDFVVDLAVHLGEERRALPRTTTTKLDLSPCWYHHHGDDVSWYRAKFLGSAV